jgi:hypothetical protein
MAMVFVVNDFVSRRIDLSRRSAPMSSAQRYCQATIPLHCREIAGIYRFTENSSAPLSKRAGAPAGGVALSPSFGHKSACL